MHSLMCILLLQLVHKTHEPNGDTILEVDNLHLTMDETTCNLEHKGATMEFSVEVKAMVPWKVA